MMLKDVSDSAASKPAGKPWKNTARFSAFVDADQKRVELLKRWEDNSVEGMQVKIKRMNSPAGFVVKTRLHPDFEPKLEKKKKKKNGKNSKRNKKNSNRRKLDAAASV